MSYVVVIALAVICLALIALNYKQDEDARNEREILARDAQASRLAWASERKELMDHMKYLNDRYLAKHAQDAVMMDRFPEEAIPREPREHRPLMPEGL